MPLKIIVFVLILIPVLGQGSRTTPHKQSVDFAKVPAQVKSFLSDENLQKMDEAGMNIYTGDNPPNIAGTYTFKDVVIKYDPAGTS
ncbi:hypothetical protein HYU93_03900 [Candidatus Daviesbacteria bacterium]|nr:hypothetical protein [Candidatus Daviesbacteria bacterium]